MAYIDTERDSFPTFHQKELNGYMKGWNTCLKSVLQQTPTADVVEVCRCKECANGYRKTDIAVMCKIWNRIMITEDYCSYGAKMAGTPQKEG